MRALRTSAEASWRDVLSLTESMYRIQSGSVPRIVRELVSAATANCPRDHLGTLVHKVSCPMRPFAGNDACRELSLLSSREVDHRRRA